MKFAYYSFAIIATINLVKGENVPIFSCGADEVKNCVVHEVRVSPCKEALKDPPQPCKFKKQKTANLEMDFTPNFATNKMHVQMYWPNGFMDLPLAGMDTDGCKTTTCPSVPAVKQTYTYNLKIENYFPISTYDVKLLLKGDDKENQICCFIYKIKISK